MKAVRVHEFGGIDAMMYEDAPRLSPGEGQVLVKVKAAGVGPWDALVRTGASKLGQPLPLILGSDIAGVVEEAGPGVTAFRTGDAVYGSTNPLFVDGYAEYAVAEAGMIAHKPQTISDVEAGGMPVVACTAWQMVYQYGKILPGQRALVHGAAGNVGAYAVQFAKEAGAEVIATAHAKDLDFVRSLGADTVIDVSKSPFEDDLTDIDIVLDTVGGETQTRSFAVLKTGGILVSSASQPNQAMAAEHGVSAVFFYVEVTTALLTAIAERIDAGKLKTNPGETLTLSQARQAHEMLAGAPHKRGKIVLTV